MRLSLLRGLLAVLSVVGFSCSDSDLPDAFRLETFRVLALIADQPEVNPGDSVTITPFLSDLFGQGRIITYSADACIDPGVGFGANPTCEGSPTQTTLATNIPVTGLSSPNYTGFITSPLTVTVPSAEVIFAQASLRNQFNGVNYLVTFEFFPNGGDPLRTFRRIVVSTRDVKNQNPIYENPPLKSNGAFPPRLGRADITLMAELTPESNEEYEEIRQDGAQVMRTETLETSWYISNGDLTPSITDENDPVTITPPKTFPSDHDVVLIMVTRDSRGGVVAHVEWF